MARPRGSKNGSGKRVGSKRKAKVQDDADTVEMRKGGELDLQQVVINDGDFDLHFRGMKNARERMKTAKNLYDGCCKAAKKVSPDLLQACKDALTIEGLDHHDIKRKLEVYGYALKRTESPVQLTVHDMLFGDVHEAAEKRGATDQKAGRACNSPYPEGSDLDTDYKRGYSNSLGAHLGLNEEQTQDAIENGGEGHGGIDDRPAAEGHNSNGDSELAQETV